MGVVPVPPTFGANGIAPSTYYNQLRDSVRFILNPPLAVLRQTVVQSLAAGSFIPVTFDVHDIDRDLAHSTTVNSSRYTSQTPGWYNVDATVCFGPSATGIRASRLTINGVAAIGRTNYFPPVSTGVPSMAPVSGPVYLDAGDYLQLEAFQSSAGALSTATDSNGAASALMIRWVST